VAYRRRYKKIGLVLGGGAARGWAHIGAIRALHDAGIKPDVVCGTSIGALVGAVMKTTRGQADAKTVRDLILERLGAS